MAVPNGVFDGERILRVLEAHSVDFVVVGGIAVQAHGYLRLRRVPLIPVMTEAGPLDVASIEHLAGAPPSYDALREAALVIELRDMEVAVAGLSDLIRMKRAAGREHDLADIEALTRDPEST